MFEAEIDLCATELDRRCSSSPAVDTSGSLTCSREISLGLIVNELATNALKYGLLSVPQGRVRIGWALSDGDLALI
jgi:two-component sensor histidine kinase